MTQVLGEHQKKWISELRSGKHPHVVFKEPR